MGISYPYILTNGTTGDADEVQANFDEIKNNFDQDTIEDASANETEFKATKLPDTESLPISGREELKVLRYQIDAILGKTTWDKAPDTNLLLEFNKGADIASATALALGVDGNYFDVTGTTAITSINTRRVGSIIKLHFDGILALTHHVTDLILPGGANITTAAGDEAEFVEYATGDWRCTNYSTAAGAVDAGHDHTGGAGAQIPQGGIASSAVGQAELKTATSSQSLDIGANQNASIALPGGTYSWWTASSELSTGGGMTFGNGNTAAGTIGFMNQHDTEARFVYVDGRYIQSSPPYKIGDKEWGHFFYVLRNKTTGEVFGTSEAEDPSWAYNGAIWIKDKNSIERMASAPHPFADYWDNPLPPELEICLIDMRGFNVAALKIDCLKNRKKADQEILKNITIGAQQSHKKYNLPDIPGFTDKVKIRKHN